MRLAFLIVATLFSIAVALRAGDQVRGNPSRATTSSRPALPPLLQTCPMHPDVVEASPGTCPLCKMALVPVRLESVWSCPVHSAITRDASGQCPICRRNLIQMTMALTWTCRGRPDVEAVEPATCPDGSAMVAKRTLRPHGNHNPQHGGQFFMAPDNTHHLEGALPSARVFRLYVYDDYARPLPAARLKAIRGRVETGAGASTLVAAANSGYLEARINQSAFPAPITAKVRIAPEGPEYRFDFVFGQISTDPSVRTAAPARPSTTRTATAPARPAEARARVPARTPAVPPPAAPPVPGIPTDGPVDPALILVPIPDSVPAMVDQLRIRDQQVRALITQGNLAAVFVPAFQARDLALALEGRLGSLPGGREDTARSAIHELVRAAWLLDAFGDVGNAEQLNAAYGPFHDAAERVAAAFGEGR